MSKKKNQLNPIHPHKNLFIVFSRCISRWRKNSKLWACEIANQKIYFSFLNEIDGNWLWVAWQEVVYVLCVLWWLWWWSTVHLSSNLTEANHTFNHKFVPLSDILTFKSHSVRFEIVFIFCSLMLFIVVKLDI